MQIIRRNRHKKLYVALLVGGLLAACVLAYALVLLAGKNQSAEVRPLGSTDYSEPSKEQIEDGNDAKQATIDKEDAAKRSEAPVAQTDDALTVSVSSTMSDDTLYVRSEIAGVYATGTCTLTLQKGSQLVQKATEVQSLAKSSTCKGFDISLSELNSGEWTVTLDVNANGKTGKASTRVTT